MLVVGTVSSNEEEREVRFIAEIFLIGERIRYLARQQKNKKIKKRGGIPHYLFMNEDKYCITQISSSSQSTFLNPSHLGSPGFY